jgi:NADH dehydrogenase
MKTVNEALAIRSEIMRRFEDLCRFEDNTKFSIAVVGGGPTGVEMAGAIAELKRGPLSSDMAEAAKNIDVYLVEAGPRVLPALSPKLSERTKSDLEKLGVKVLTGAVVKEVKPRQIQFADGTSIPSEVSVWAAGVRGEPAIAKLNIPQENGRVAVDPTMQVTNYPYVFAIGDAAGAKGTDGRFLPMVAPVAMQQARFVAKQIARLTSQKPLEKFKYIDKGSMATIGRHKAVVEVKGIRIGGVIAWYMWLWLHLFYLLGGRNKIGTMADWTWNYLTFDRGNRHIMDIS